MGMSIDASLNKLQEMHNIMEYEIDLIKEPDEKAWNREFINSLETAISTMQKYQKIEQILKDDTYYEECGNNAENFIVSAISEVADGNDD